MYKLLIFLLLIPTLAYSQQNMAEFCENNPTHWKCQSLPVELLYFKGIQENDSVNLYWSTASEYQSSHFLIEGSDDAISFIPLDIVYSSNSTTNQQQYYQFKATHYTYYRLIQVDIDGRQKYYNMIVVQYKTKRNKKFKTDTIGRTIN